MIYENTRYFIRVNEKQALDPEDIDLFGEATLRVDDAFYTEWYEVVNKESGIVELKTINLIEGISTAAASDVTLENKPWEWYYTQGAKDQQSPPEILN